MKKLSVLFTLLLTIAVLISIVGCKDKGNEPNLMYTVTKENHVDPPYVFPNGIYYSYVFPEPLSYEFDVDPVFRRTLGYRVTIRDAWYKRYSGDCLPPGSNIALTVIVPPALVIRLDQRDANMQLAGFVETSNPNMDDCAYYVTHFRFQN